MLTLQRVLFVIAFTFLSIHCLRLTYQQWFEPRTSALDVYDESVEADIREAKSLDELLARFDAAQETVRDYESDEANPRYDPYERHDIEPYMSERLLREAVVDWERRSKEIGKVRLYWFWGLIFLIAGLALHKWLNAWLGVGALTVAFSEMIYWSSPSYFGDPSQQFERLLDNKFALAWLSFVLLLVAGFVSGTISRANPARS